MYDELLCILAADLPHQDDAVKLAEVLYERCYIRSILDPPPEALDSNYDLTASLAAANTTNPEWDEGWRIDQLLDGGRILARKGNAARSFLPGEYLTHSGLGVGPKAGEPVSIFLPPGSAELQPGFYHAFGTTASDFNDHERTLRFYWNVSAEGAPRLVEAVTREFNRFQVAFHFKSGNRIAHYSRRDAAVLYVHARYYAMTALLLERIHSQIRASLNPCVPLFARRLADGLGFAEDPGQSFGQHRSKILAGAMLASQGQPAQERLQVVRRKFVERGLSLDKPWLNAGSIDGYEFPLPVS